MPRKSPHTDTEIVPDQKVNPNTMHAGAEEDAQPQTEPESIAKTGAGPAVMIVNEENIPSPHTGSDNSLDAADGLGPNIKALQTETDNALDDAQTSGSLDKKGPETLIYQTDSEIEGIQPSGSLGPSPEQPVYQTEIEKANMPASSAKPGRRSAEEQDIPSQSGSEAIEPGTNTIEQSKPARRQRRRDPIVSIDAQRTVQTDADMLRDDILDGYSRKQS